MASRAAGIRVLVAAGRRAACAGLVTLALCFPVLAYRTEQNEANLLVLRPRWELVALAGGAAFLLCFFWQLLGPSRRRRGTAAAGVTMFGRTRWLGPLLFGAALAYPGLAALGQGGLGEARYWIDLGILTLTYVMLGWGLNIVVGLAGLLDLGYVAFYAIGAYAYALLAKGFGVSFWLCLPIAGSLAALWGLVLGFPVLRLRGDYLAVVTLAFGEIIRLVLINWADLTGGSAGLSSIPRITFFGVPFSDDDHGFAALLGIGFDPMHRVLFLYYVILVLALMTNAVALRLRRLPIGRAWEALREDEIACRALGINTARVKLAAFAVGAMFGGFGGCFFAVRQGFVSPESFTFIESAVVLAIVVLGGMGSQLGVALAAVIMVVVPELLRDMVFFSRMFGNSFDVSQYRLLVFGIGMVAMMIWRPRGIVGHRIASLTLPQAGKAATSAAASRTE
jgi:branched-chain amino acid transport system permease protein